MSKDNLRDTAGKILRVLGNKPVCIMHHWDMDGVAAAATVSLVSTGVVGYYVPPYTYRVTGEIIEELRNRCRNAGALVIVDYNLPGGTLDLIWAKLQKTIIVVDHHYQPEPPKKPFILWFNPAASGDPRGFWPSAAHVAASLTGMYKPVVIALSILGDLRDKARANRIYQKYMVEAGFDHVKDHATMTECVSQVMAADIMGRRDILEHLASRLADPHSDPCSLLLGDGLLSILRVQAEDEFQTLLREADDKAKVLADTIIYRMEGKGRHVSTLARILSEKHPDKIVVVSYYWRPLDRTYIYLRTLRERPRLVDILSYTRSAGFTSGGKYQPGNNVVGIEVDGRAGEDVIEKVVSWIHRTR